ncbi:hypothetical protein K525DRAFT_291576 [Schizophyllum commune Loenen D]|nr:hypothetical protein K525DRAFT_291576 [Schizophyllum commune Loenen D]
MPPKKKKIPKTAPEAANQGGAADRPPRAASSKGKQRASAGEDGSGGDSKQVAVAEDTKTPVTKRREQWTAAQENTKTPLTNTRPARNTKLRQKVFSLTVGVSCLVTGLRHHPHFLHVAHIFEALREDIGISVFKNGTFLKKILNLDTSVNQEILCAWLHLLFDGTSVRKNIGQGPFAFVLKNLLEILNNIVNNKGKRNYRELAPNAVYEYELWCFENTNYFLGRYTGAERNYDHLEKEPQVQENVKEDIQLDEEHPVEETGEVGTDHASAVINPEEVPSDESFRNGDCEPLALTVGKQNFTVWSPMNPYLVTFDLMVKMNYRMKKRERWRILPPSWVSLYKDEMQPKTAHWLPTEAEALAKKKEKAARERQPDGRTTENSNRGQDYGAPITDVRPAEPPASPAQPPDQAAEASASTPPSSPSRDEPTNSSPLGAGVTHFDRSADAAIRVQQPDFDAADALRESSPAAPPSRQVSPAVLPDAAFGADAEESETPPMPVPKCGDENQTKSAPDRPRQTKNLPKRTGKSNPPPAASTHPAHAARRPPPQDGQQPGRASAREAKAPDKAQESEGTQDDAYATLPPVPKPPDKTGSAPLQTSDSSDPDPPDETALPPLGAEDSSTAIPRAARTPKAPDKSRDTRASGPSMPPPTTGTSTSTAQTTGRRQTRAAAKRALEETDAQEADDAEPEPPDRPPDRRRVNTRNRPKDPQIERNHDPPESAKGARSVHFHDRPEDPDIERDHDPPDLNKSRRRGRNR